MRYWRLALGMGIWHGSTIPALNELMITFMLFFPSLPSTLNFELEELYSRNEMEWMDGWMQNYN